MAVRNSSCLQPSAASTVILPIFYATLFTTGFCGNISLWIFIKLMNRKTSTHIYMTNLVISNLLACTVWRFTSAYYADGMNWSDTSVMCYIITHFGALITPCCMYLSITILCCIAISRYATLIKHNDCTQITLQSVYKKIFLGCKLKRLQQPKWAKYLCTGIWIFVLCPTIPIMVSYSVVEVKSAEGNVCYNEKVELGGGIAQISSLIAVSLFFIFYTVLMVSYYSLVRYLHKTQLHTCIGDKLLMYGKVKRNIIIQIILTICFVPHHIFRIVFYALHDTKNCQRLSFWVEIKNILICLAVSRGSFDTILYICIDKTFKKHFNSLFRKSPQYSDTSTATK